MTHGGVRKAKGEKPKKWDTCWRDRFRIRLWCILKSGCCHITMLGLHALSNVLYLPAERKATIVYILSIIYSVFIFCIYKASIQTVSHISHIQIYSIYLDIQVLVSSASFSCSRRRCVRYIQYAP
jgi:hypothetical protein